MENPPFLLNWVIVKSFGIVGLQQRDLRRSCASELTDTGVSLPIVQMVLNPHSLTATQHICMPSRELSGTALQQRADRIIEAVHT